MIKPIIFIVLNVLISSALFAQQTEAGVAKIQYKNESSFSPFIHSNGWGLNYRRGKHLTGRSQKMFEFELAKIKHSKEIKGKNSRYEGSRDYVYGKLNSVIAFRPGLGIQRTLYSKENRGAVEIRYSLFGGASLAFAKPVYLEIIRPTYDPDIERISTEKYNPAQHSLDNIYGKAPFSKGIGQTKVHPGLYGKLAISVEHSPEDDKIRAIETGITFDYYGKSVPIMATEENHPYFLNLYISLVYGRRWF